MIYAAAALPTGNIGRLCILTTGRAGSELLVELLDSHPRMRCEGEILENPFRDPLRYIKGRVAVARLRKLDAYGFKINHLNARVGTYRTNLGALVEGLADSGFSFVRLRRANLLRQAISSMRAGATRRYHTRDAAPTTDAMHLDPVAVIHMMRSIESYEERIDGYVADIACVSLTYEDHLESAERRDETLGRLFALAGLEPVTATSTLQRTTPRGLADSVENHEELTDVLSRTRFACHLFD